MNAPVRAHARPAGNDLTLTVTQGMDVVEEWRRSVLTGVATSLADPNLPEVQKQGGLWKWNAQIPYPNDEHLLVLDNGCLKFELEVDKQVVVFSLWLQVGEVRLGIKVPNRLVTTAVIDEKLAKAYDGTPCQRKEHFGECRLFDWIWTDSSFTEFNFMVRSLRDPVLGAVLVDRLSSIAVHLYMAVANILIEAHNLQVSFRVIRRQALKGVVVEVSGNAAVFEDYARRLDYVIRKRMDAEKGRQAYWLLMPAGSSIAKGELHDHQGAKCNVVDVQLARANLE